MQLFSRFVEWLLGRKAIPTDESAQVDVVAARVWAPRLSGCELKELQAHRQADNLIGAALGALSNEVEAERRRALRRLGGWQ